MIHEKVSSYHGCVPARKLAALRALGIGDGDERLRTWSIECRKIAYDSALPFTKCLFASAYGNKWLESNKAAAYLDCLFGDEFAAEREACPECKGNPKYGVSPRYLDQPHNRDEPCPVCHGLGSVRTTVECPRCWLAREGRDESDSLSRIQCSNCNNTGRIPALLIDPRWRTGDVIGLVRAIRGGFTCTFCKTWKPEYSPEECRKCKHRGYMIHQPAPDRMPILADALEEAMGDSHHYNAELLAHCRSDGPHLPQCYLIREILGGK